MIHTYMHTSLAITTLKSGLRPSFSHTTRVMCVNFIRELRGVQFNVDYERQIFEKLFMAILEKSAEKIAEDMLFYFIFRFDA